MDYFDFTIWVDCPQDVAAHRGIARDLSEYGVDSSEDWRKVWIPQERAYAERYRPIDIADFVIETHDG